MPEPLTGPPGEPLTLAEAKAFLRVSSDAEDTLIGALITAARRMVEARTSRILMDQTWRLVRDAWPASGIIAAPVAPLREVSAARVKRLDGSFESLDLSAFTLNAGRAPALITVDLSRVPLPLVRQGGIGIDVLAGYGPNAADVPADLAQAVRLLIAHFYEHRDTAGASSALPEAAEALLAPYRVVRL